jgi:hypothetical protein
MHRLPQGHRTLSTGHVHGRCERGDGKQTLIPVFELLTICFLSKVFKQALVIIPRQV